MAAPSPSILNDILGPVMRGPSSSQTAGSYHIGKLCAALLGSRPARARITFDREGSYGQVYRQQGVDRAFACAFLEWPLTDSRFFCALESAAGQGLDLQFRVGQLEAPDHPSAVDVELWDKSGTGIRARAKSVGGGAVEVTRADGWNPIPLDETIDAVFAVGKMMPSELRCTAKGDLAATPTALRLHRKRSETGREEAGRSDGK